MSSDGRSETEVRRRVQAGANAWRQVEGVMSDRHISKKLKGKVLGACVPRQCCTALRHYLCPRNTNIDCRCVKTTG